MSISTTPLKEIIRADLKWTIEVLARAKGRVEACFFYSYDRGRPSNSGALYPHRKAKEAHELISSLLLRLAVLLVHTTTTRTTTSGVAQEVNRSTATCSLGL